MTAHEDNPMNRRTSLRPSRTGYCALSLAFSLALALGTQPTAHAQTPGPAPAQAQGPVLQVLGSWSSQWGAGQCNLSMTQYGPHVVGIATNPPPVQPTALVGTLNGTVLTGRWTDARSSGGFVLQFTPDGRHFTGTWGRTLDSTSSGGPWNGQHL